MKFFLLFLATAWILTSCGLSRNTSNYYKTQNYQHDLDSSITESLFQDKSATISEENIQKILDGNYNLPQQLRVAIIRLENSAMRRGYWNDEDYLKTQQAYLDLFTENLKQSQRVKKVSIVPSLLLAAPTFTNIREAAVRIQADVVLIYSITNNIYSKYKLFKKDDIKAYANTQLMLMDVRTGLIPFSTIVSKDVLAQKTKEELNQSEANARIQKAAVLLTIDEISQRLKEFLK